MEGRYIYYIERYMKEMGVRGGVGYRGDGGAYGGYIHMALRSSEIGSP